MTTVDVVTVTYGSSDLALGCIASVRDANAASQELDLRMIVLDNASPDDTAKRIQDGAPWVDLVQRRRNDGFAVACNEGITRGSGEFVLLLNPDAALAPGILTHLIDRLEADPEIGMIGPRLIQADGTFDHAAKRASPGPVEAFKYLLGKLIGRDLGSQYLAPAVDEHSTGSVDAINGAFMLLPRTVVERIGLLDESYWMYGEDLDWCRRVRGAGLKVVYDGRVTCFHLKGGSSGRIRRPKTNWHFHTSMWRYYRTDPSRPGPVESVVVAAGIGMHWFVTSALWLREVLRGKRA